MLICSEISTYKLMKKMMSIESLKELAVKIIN